MAQKWKFTMAFHQFKRDKIDAYNSLNPTHRGIYSGQPEKIPPPL